MARPVDALLLVFLSQFGDWVNRGTTCGFIAPFLHFCRWAHSPFTGTRSRWAAFTPFRRGLDGLAAAPLVRILSFSPHRALPLLGPLRCSAPASARLTPSRFSHLLWDDAFCVSLPLGRFLPFSLTLWQAFSFVGLAACAFPRSELPFGTPRLRSLFHLSPRMALLHPPPPIPSPPSYPASRFFFCLSRLSPASLRPFAFPFTLCFSPTCSTHASSPFSRLCRSPVGSPLRHVGWALRCYCPSLLLR